MMTTTGTTAIPQQTIECKVVLLGKEHVGKTCVMERFVHERFLNQSETQSTVGVVFGAKQIIVNGRTVRLSLWDTAGSERFTSISRLYYRNAKAAVVCYDITDSTSLDRCLFWIEELQKTEEQCRIYLVGTKLDLFSENPRNRKVQISDVEKISKEIGATTCETSSRTGRGISELFSTIAQDFVNSLPPSALIQNEPQFDDSFHVSSGATEPQSNNTKKKGKDCFSGCRNL